MLTPCSVTLKTWSSTSFNRGCQQWGTSTTWLTLCLDWPSLTFLLVPWTPLSMQSWSDKLMNFLWFSFRRAWAHALFLRFLQQEGCQKHVWMVGQSKISPGLLVLILQLDDTLDVCGRCFTIATLRLRVLVMLPIKAWTAHSIDWRCSMLQPQGCEFESCYQSQIRHVRYILKKASIDWLIPNPPWSTKLQWVGQLLYMFYPQLKNYRCF